MYSNKKKIPQMRESKLRQHLAVKKYTFKCTKRVIISKQPQIFGVEVQANG